MAEEIRFHNGAKTGQEKVVWVVSGEAWGRRRTRTTCMRRGEEDGINKKERTTLLLHVVSDSQNDRSVNGRSDDFTPQPRIRS